MPWLTGVRGPYEINLNKIMYGCPTSHVGCSTLGEVNSSHKKASFCSCPRTAVVSTHPRISKQKISWKSQVLDSPGSNDLSGNNLLYQVATEQLPSEVTLRHIRAGF
ncbi:unnamed protein product, partial [Ectocarpus sp. 13 AM-2016]